MSNFVKSGQIHQAKLIKTNNRLLGPRFDPELQFLVLTFMLQYSVSVLTAIDYPCLLLKNMVTGGLANKLDENVCINWKMYVS